MTILAKHREQWPAIRYIACIMAVWIIAGLFGSCTAKQQKDTFRVAMECGYAPYNWTQLDDSNGAVPISGTNQFANGYDVQIAQLVADQLGKELVIIKTSWEGLIPGLLSGQFDAIAAGMSATTERKEKIDFSDEYYYSNFVVVVRKDNPYAQAKSLQDLSGIRITAQLGTTHYNVIEQIPTVKKQSPLEDFPAMIVALQAGTIDGYVSEKPGALSASKANPSLTFVEFSKENGFQFDDQEVTIGMGLPKGSPLKNNINAALSTISTDQRAQIMEEAIANQPANNVDTEHPEQEENFLQSLVSIIRRYWKHFLRGAATTLLIAISGTLVGLLIGLFIATFRMMELERTLPIVRLLHHGISMLLTAYVEIIRGTPMMVQAMVFFYGFRALSGLDMPRLLAGILIVSFNTGAYMTEVVRGGIDSVDTGQFEAAKAIGMTHPQTMRSIVLPQAIRNILPATGNEFVINIKDTSVLNVIAVTELYFANRDVLANTLRTFESYLITAIIYFILTFSVTRILHAVERRMDGPQNYMLTSSTMPDSVVMHQKQGRK